MDDKARIRQLDAEIQQLKRRLDQRPPVFTMTQLVDRRIEIDQGQTLESGDLGIKYSSDPITDLPGPLDPNTTTSFSDGIGRGTLYIDGVAQDGYVLVINDSLAGIQSAVIQSDFAYASRPISMSNGSGSQTVYRIF